MALSLLSLPSLERQFEPFCVIKGLTRQASCTRNGFVVPSGRLLQVDDMSVDCVIASEVFDEQEFSKAGVATTAVLRMSYPINACPEALDSEGDCPLQDYTVGTAAAWGLRVLFIQPGQPNRFVLRV